MPLELVVAVVVTSEMLAVLAVSLGVGLLPIALV
jgi:hypothetical protein